MEWIGLHYSDIQSLQLPLSVRQPFSKHDITKCKGLQQYYSYKNPIKTSLCEAAFCFL